MFDGIAPRYDLVNRVMTGGLDQRWRRTTLRALALPAGAVVLDLGCGTGDFSRLAPGAGLRMVGADLSWGMLANGSGTRLQADAASLPLATAVVDGVVSGFALRNFTDLDACLREAARVLRPGGRLALLEVAEPAGPLLRRGHRLWFRTAVPRIGAALSDADAYRYLPRSTAYLPSEDGLRHLLRRAGFATVNRRPLWGGLSQLLTATRCGMPGAARA